MPNELILFVFNLGRHAENDLLNLYLLNSTFYRPLTLAKKAV